MSDTKPTRAASELHSIEALGARLGLQSRIRPNATTPVPVLSNTENLTQKTYYFGAPGTVTVFIGRSKASIDRVRGAVDEGGESVTAIVHEILTPPEGDATLEDTLNAIAEAPVFATLMYGGTPLVEHLHVPSGRDLIGFTLPYNGGRLATQGFQLRQFYQPGAAMHEAIALYTMPALSRAEAAALEQVPDPDLWQNVGPISDCNYACGVAFASGAVAGGALGASLGGLAGPVGAIAGGVAGGLAGGAGFVAGYTAVTAALGTRPEDVPIGAGHAGVHTIISTLTLSDLDVQRLGAQGTARALLELRRIALLQSSGREGY